MGITACAVYTDEEQNAIHVKEADEAYCLGIGSLTETYLNIALIIDIAQKSECEAIHPGYGFLSENALLAEACESAGIIFIGPNAASIKLMGNKLGARRFVEDLGIPLLTSIIGSSLDEIIEKSKALPFPLLIKAAAGGGGKGMKIAKTLHELPEAYESASREALSYFGDATVYLEHYIQNPRHIEVQLLGDNLGNIVHLYERECSIQRRHQKIIEEAPSPSLTQPLREKLLQTALHIAKAMNYTSAGTLEFLFDEEMNFFFLEMNTRIQVEHPVTEAITGIDIVREQINIARGLPVSIKQEDIKINGHAIECRIYAEDPFNDFMPCPGNMTGYILPKKANIRIDSSFEGSEEVSSRFDPMIAKITAHAATREQAIFQLISYFSKVSIQGIKTNVEYLSEVLQNNHFKNNNISTGFCAQHATELQNSLLSKKNIIPTEYLIAGVLVNTFFSKCDQTDTIWKSLGPWKSFGEASFSINNMEYGISYKLFDSKRIQFNLNNQDHLVELHSKDGQLYEYTLDIHQIKCWISNDNTSKTFITLSGFSFEIDRKDVPDISVFKNKKINKNNAHDKDLRSPLNGKVIKMNVKKGDKVNKGQTLLIIESMKMENKILAPFEGLVEEVTVAAGDQVTGQELLMKLHAYN